MVSKRDFTIPFVGLKEGKHKYSYNLGDSFFESFDYGLVDSGAVTVELILDKMSTMMVLLVDIQGEVEAECDLCLDGLHVQAKGNYRLIIKFGDEAFEETDEILVLPHGAHELDLFTYLYEFVMLSLPSRKVHSEGQCNADMIERINQGSEDEDDIEETDPRWAALKELKKSKP